MIEYYNEVLTALVEFIESYKKALYAILDEELKNEDDLRKVE